MGFFIEIILCPKCETKNARKTTKGSFDEFVKIECSHCGYKTKELPCFAVNAIDGEMINDVQAVSKGEAAIIALEGLGCKLEFLDISS